MILSPNGMFFAGLPTPHGMGGAYSPTPVYTVNGIPIYPEFVLLVILGLGIAFYPFVIWNNRKKRKSSRKKKDLS